MRSSILAFAVLCVSFAFYACSSSDDAASASPVVDGGGSVPETGAPDGAVEPAEAGPANRGRIFAFSDSTLLDGGARFQTSAGASFTPNAPSDSTLISGKSVGPCLVEQFRVASQDPAPEVSAGALHFAGGSTSAIVLAPNADHTYDAKPGTVALWKGGESITVTADGKDVPAFTVTAIAPPTVTLTTPATPAAGGSLSLTRSAPFSATWTGGTASASVVLYFDTASSLKAVTTTCTFKASDGKAEVPAEAFADFPASSGTWQAYSLQLGEATPAGWGVRFTMSSGAIDPAGASVQGAVDYK